MSGSAQASQVELLHHISGIVSSGLALDRILSELIGLTTQVTQCDACLVYLLDHTSQEIVLRASKLPHDAEIGVIRMKMGEGVTGWVAAHRSVAALPSKAASDARFKMFPALPEDAYDALLSVPLVSGGELIGVMNVHHRQERGHTPEEVALVSFIGEQMGAAMHKARLAEQSKTAMKRIETLAALARAISTNSYLDRILQAISEMVADTFDSPVTSIMLIDDETQELVISAAHCCLPGYLHRVPIKLDDSLIGRVVRDGTPAGVLDVAAEKEYRYPELARKAGLASLLCAPLLAREKAIGALNIYTREQRRFSEDEIGFVRVVAHLAAIAVENARLMAETLEMKRTLESRKLVERAKGILQHRHGLTEEEAYLRLRSESRRLRRPMRELAEAVILAEDLHRPGTGEAAEMR
jgi:signal transduction protein with GAF and PtsI domain